MSKIFDSLRRAEQERKNQAKRGEVENKVTPIHPVPAPSSQPDASSFPEGLLRELGILKNSIDSALRDKARKTMVFTSAVGGEGTTTISSSFARLLAMQDQGRTLLCEMNARRPAFGDVFAFSSDRGISDIFLGKGDLASVIHHTQNANLDVVPIGQQDPALIQIHLKNFFPNLVSQAVAMYDTVIFDAPAVVSSPETPAMAAHVDGVVLVVQSGKTKREIVQRSMESIQRAEGSILGVILNRKKYYIPDFLYKRI